MVPKIIKTATQIAESSGLKNPDAYYPAVSDQDLAAMTGQAAQMAGQPDPRTKLEQQRLEAEIAKGQAELQVSRQKGVAQMQMDRARSDAVLALQRETMMLEA